MGLVLSAFARASNAETRAVSSSLRVSRLASGLYPKSPSSAISFSASAPTSAPISPTNSPSPRVATVTVAPPTRVSTATRPFLIKNTSSATSPSLMSKSPSRTKRVSRSVPKREAAARAKRAPGELSCFADSAWNERSEGASPSDWRSIDARPVSGGPRSEAT